MNSIRQIRALNQRELDAGVPPSASWHTDYRDTAYIYIGGLPFTLSEGDVLTIFSQYGNPAWINLIRDKETGKSKGFAFLKYEDQRSTDLAVDNLGGVEVMGRVLRVDHTRYSRKDDEVEEGVDLLAEEMKDIAGEDVEDEGDDVTANRPLLREERELANLIQDHDDDDPMKNFLIEEKKAEVSRALASSSNGNGSRRGRGSSHRHHRSHRDHGERYHSSRHHRGESDAENDERPRRARREPGSPRKRSTPPNHDHDRYISRRHTEDDRRRESRRDDRHGSRSADSKEEKRRSESHVYRRREHSQYNK